MIKTHTRTTRAFNSYRKRRIVRYAARASVSCTPVYSGLSDPIRCLDQNRHICAVTPRSSSSFDPLPVHLNVGRCDFGPFADALFWGSHRKLESCFPSLV